MGVVAGGAACGSKVSLKTTNPKRQRGFEAHLLPVALLLPVARRFSGCVPEDTALERCKQLATRAAQPKQLAFGPGWLAAGSQGRHVLNLANSSPSNSETQSPNQAFRFSHPAALRHSCVAALLESCAAGRRS